MIRILADFPACIVREVKLSSHFFLSFEENIRYGNLLLCQDKSWLKTALLFSYSNKKKKKEKKKKKILAVTDVSAEFRTITLVHFQTAASCFM